MTDFRPCLPIGLAAVMLSATSVPSVGIAAPSAIVTAQGPNAQSQQQQQTEPARRKRAGSDEALQENPEDKVAADKVFKEAVIKKRRTIQEVEAAKHRYLYPSLSFMSFMQPYILRLTGVAFLQDNAKNLIRAHPDCRIIPGTESAYTAKIACNRVAQFRAEGEEVIFNYALTNEVIVGAVYSFGSKRRAKQFTDMAKEILESGHEVITYQPDADTTIHDSEFFSITMQPGRNGYMVVVDAHHQDKLADIEEYGKAKLQKIEFGDLTVGKTRVEELPHPDLLPKVCIEVSEDRESTERREYYGQCFGFPYEAHMQFDFNAVTGIMKSAVLSPIGTATGKIVDAMLSERYHLASACRKLNTDQELVPIRRDNNKRSYRGKGRSLRNTPSLVYAGTCDNPIIYTVDMRYIFENRYLNKEDIAADFERRKALVDSAADSKQEYATRVDKMKGFFQ